MITRVVCLRSSSSWFWSRCSLTSLTTFSQSLVFHFVWWAFIFKICHPILYFRGFYFCYILFTTHILHFFIKKKVLFSTYVQFWNVIKYCTWVQFKLLAVLYLSNHYIQLQVQKKKVHDQLVKFNIVIK